MRTRGFRSTFVSVLVLASLVIPIGAAAAAPGDVVISEFMYHPESDVSPDEFLEIHNAGATSVDISDWCFSGITFCFPPGTSLPAGGFDFAYYRYPIEPIFGLAPFGGFCAKWLLERQSRVVDMVLRVTVGLSIVAHAYAAQYF